MNKMSLMTTATLLGVVSMLMTPNSVSAAERRPSDVPNGEKATVTKVIDGDTIEVNLNGQTVTVNYIGVGAPEAGACYGTQATAANSSLVNGKRVVLEKDEVDADVNGALWRYVYLLDGRMANEEMMRSGSARTAIERPNIKHLPVLAAFEADAFANKRGLWGKCGLTAPQSAYSSTVCANIAVEDLLIRSDNFTDKNLLKAGDCVNIIKAENPAGAAWQGQYVYYPKGSVISLSNGYVRWKDAFVPMTLDENGKPFVFKSQYFPPVVNRGGPGQRPSITPGRTEAGMVELVRDEADQSVLKLPGLSFLFRDVGGGKYEALVDVFVYRSGELRNPVVNDQGYVM
jgi:micrococcal nuclease